MDVPILTAVIGVSGTLMGTIVGGCLTMFTNFLLNKRREQAEVRMGCRLIAGELWENEGFIGSWLQGKRWWPSELEPGTKAWEEHQHILASHLPNEAWRDVRSAIRAVYFARGLSVTAHATNEKIIDDALAPLLAGYVEDLKKGQASLQSYLTKSKPDD
jgi:hypothetical protein